MMLDFFPINKPPQEFASVKNFAASLLDLQKNDISKVLSAENGYYLLKVVDKKPSYLPKLNIIENEVTRRFIESETQILAEKEAKSILDTYKVRRNS